MARSLSTLVIRKRWKRTLRNVSGRRMLSPLPIRRLPRSKRRLSVCCSKRLRGEADGDPLPGGCQSPRCDRHGCLCREPAIDFLSANEAKLEAVPDPEVLAFAAHQNRILSLPISGQCRVTSV